MNLQTNKNLGVIGALLIVFGTIYLVIRIDFSGYSIFGCIIIIIVGIILSLINLYNLAKFYQAKNIFTNACIGAVTAIISSIVFMSLTTTIVNLYTDGIILKGIFTICLMVAAFFVNRSLKELTIQSGINEITSIGKTLLCGTAFIGGAILMPEVQYIVSYYILEIFAIFGIVTIDVAFLSLAIEFSKMKKIERPLSITTEKTSSSIE